MTLIVHSTNATETTLALRVNTYDGFASEMAKRIGKQRSL